MNQDIGMYLMISIGLGIIYTIIPVEKNPIKNMFVFIAVGLLLLFVYRKYVVEKFDNLDISNNNSPIIVNTPTQPTMVNNPTLPTMVNNPTLPTMVNNPIQPPVVNNPIQPPVVNNPIQPPTIINTEINNTYLNELMLLKEQINELKNNSADTSCDKKVAEILSKYLAKGKYIDDKGLVSNMLDNDMKYNQLNPEEMQPLGTYDNTFTNKWDHGFTYLNTDKWAPPIRKLQQNKIEKECTTCPTLTNGYPLNLMEFDNSRKILPPDNINLDYIKDRLNNQQ